MYAWRIGIKINATLAMMLSDSFDRRTLHSIRHKPFSITFNRIFFSLRDSFTFGAPSVHIKFHTPESNGLSLQSHRRHEMRARKKTKRMGERIRKMNKIAIWKQGWSERRGRMLARAMRTNQPKMSESSDGAEMALGKLSGLEFEYKWY